MGFYPTEEKVPRRYLVYRDEYEIANPIYGSVTVPEFAYIGEVEETATKSLKKFERIFLRTVNLKFGIFLSGRRLFDLLQTSPFDKIFTDDKGLVVSSQIQTRKYAGSFPAAFEECSGFICPYCL